ncbi:hypothetical protein PY32053_04150 (plasmid) [Paracoccus yeei]|uniref:Uncharacterized protein n=1 Tax=Paracoccus yeei TaxID=147645 RepID=A0A386UTJ5_9RHOB|nr:hypothetical protein PY32053_04150 [Paracoccus yeei]
MPGSSCRTSKPAIKQAGDRMTVISPGISCQFQPPEARAGSAQN